MSEVPQLEHVNKKRAPVNDQFLFILCLKNEFFRLTEGYPHDWCHRTMKKTILQ